MKKQIAVIIAVVALVCVGCESTGLGSKTYTRAQAQTPLQVYTGTLLAVADVEIQGEERGGGAAVGAVVGGIVGSTVGAGQGRKLATTAGALGGAAAGSAAERARATKPALELEVELDDGRIVVIVQEKDDEFRVGDRVRIIESSDGTMRVRQ